MEKSLGCQTQNFGMGSSENWKFRFLFRELKQTQYTALHPVYTSKKTINLP